MTATRREADRSGTDDFRRWLEQHASDTEQAAARGNEAPLWKFHQAVCLCEYFRVNTECALRSRVSVSVAGELKVRGWKSAASSEAEWAALLSDAIAGGVRRKAAGPDGVPMEALQAAAVRCTAMLAPIGEGDLPGRLAPFT